MITLSDASVEAAALSMYGFKGWGHMEGGNIPDSARLQARAAITAYLQAEIQAGRASIGKGMNELQQFYPALILKLSEPSK